MKVLEDIYSSYGLTHRPEFERIIFLSPSGGAHITTSSSLSLGTTIQPCYSVPNEAAVSLQRELMAKLQFSEKYVAPFS